MTAYIARRILMMPIVIILLTIFVFGMLRAVPGDVVAAKLGNNYSQDQAVRLKKEYGLDEPAWRQYGVWAGRVMRGNFGHSFITSRPIAQDFKDRVPVTLELLLLIMAMQVPLGISLGVLAAVSQNRLPDYGVRILSILMLAIPSFWLATLVIILPLRWWGWSLPIGYSELWDDPRRNLYQLSVPAALAALASAAVLIRITRSQMLDVLASDYVRTARAKGLSPAVVLVRHGLKNALIPIVTVIGLSVASGFSGLVIMEQIFSIPGIGSYSVNALANRDYPAIQAVVLVVGLVFTVVNLLVDMSYAFIDPRVRFS